MPPKKTDPTIEALQAELAALRAEYNELAAAHKAKSSKPAQPVGDVSIGTLRIVNGVLALSDTHYLDQTWRTAGQTQTSRIAVDFCGPHAEYLARRTQLPVEKLGDGTLRIHVQAQPQAAHFVAQANQWLAREASTDAEPTTARVSVLAATGLRCHDAVRGVPAAVVAEDGAPAFLAVAASAVAVTMTPATEGKPAVLHLTLA